MAEESDTPRGPEKPGRPGKNDSFEETFSQLEETVRKLEAGQLPLDQATGLFEEGMKLNCAIKSPTPVMTPTAAATMIWPRR